LDPAARIDRERRARAVRMTDVQLMELGPAAIGGDDELTAGAPTEASHGVVRGRDRALWCAAGGPNGPRLVGPRALVGDDRECRAVGRERERRTAREATGGVRHL